MNLENSWVRHSVNVVCREVCHRVDLETLRVHPRQVAGSFDPGRRVIVDLRYTETWCVRSNLRSLSSADSTTSASTGLPAAAQAGISAGGLSPHQLVVYIYRTTHLPMHFRHGGAASRAVGAARAQSTAPGRCPFPLPTPAWPASVSALTCPAQQPGSPGTAHRALSHHLGLLLIHVVTCHTLCLACTRPVSHAQILWTRSDKSGRVLLSPRHLCTRARGLLPRPPSAAVVVVPAPPLPPRHLAGLAAGLRPARQLPLRRSPNAGVAAHVIVRSCTGRRLGRHRRANVFLGPREVDSARLVKFAPLHHVLAGQEYCKVCDARCEPAAKQMQAYGFGAC